MTTNWWSWGKFCSQASLSAVCCMGRLLFRHLSCCEFTGDALLVGGHPQAWRRAGRPAAAAAPGLCSHQLRIKILGKWDSC